LVELLHSLLYFGVIVEVEVVEASGELTIEFSEGIDSNYFLFLVMEYLLFVNSIIYLLLKVPYELPSSVLLLLPLLNQLLHQVLLGHFL